MRTSRFRVEGRIQPPDRAARSRIRALTSPEADGRVAADMKKPVRWILRIVIAVVVLGALFVGIGLTEVPVPATSNFNPSMQEVRALATSTGEPLPTQLRSQKVGVALFPKGAVVGGGGMEKQSMTFYAYQLVYEDGRTVIIDAVHDEQLQKAIFPDSTFLNDSYARVQQSLRKANAIAATHEHFDHVGGIAKSPDREEIIPRVVLTEEQLRNPRIKEGGFDEALIKRLQPLRYDRLHLLRPGVVLIKAPGHTPGSQLVYARLADGRELLLLGDIAWNMANVRLPRMHPRAVNWINGEDGEAMAHQLRFLHDLAAREPNLHQVSAHDGEQMEDYVRRGLIQDGLL
jgi:glyoxylase-like metal-dependent hydrolase (beta-lactamase superfamily II)